MESGLFVCSTMLPGICTSDASDAKLPNDRFWPEGPKADIEFNSIANPLSAPVFLWDASCGDFVGLCWDAV
jgi:hypothetical protein